MFSRVCLSKRVKSWVRLCILLVPCVFAEYYLFHYCIAHVLLSQPRSVPRLVDYTGRPSKRRSVSWHDKDLSLLQPQHVGLNFTTLRCQLRQGKKGTENQAINLMQFGNIHKFTRYICRSRYLCLPEYGVERQTKVLHSKRHFYIHVV